jgi:YHS domain-containing protein
MKSFIGITCIIGILIGTGCNSAGNKQTEFDSVPVDTTPKKDYSNVMFASKKDTTCGMPLSVGVGDTLHWNGKVFGFCSKQCKDAFAEKLKKENKL